MCFILLIKCEAPANKKSVKLIQYNSARQCEGVTRCTRCAKCDGLYVHYLQGNVSMRQYTCGTIAKTINSQRRVRSTCLFPVIISDRLRFVFKEINRCLVLLTFVCLGISICMFRSDHISDFVYSNRVRNKDNSIKRI